MYRSLSLLSLLAITSQAATVFNGEGTFYSPGIGFGSCGVLNQDTEFVAALAQVTMRQYNPSNPNNNPVCGHKVRVWETSNPANSVVVAIEDTCPGCHGAYDLDLSPAAFNRLDKPEVGRIKISWEFVEPVTLKTGPFAGAVPAGTTTPPSSPPPPKPPVATPKKPAPKKQHCTCVDVESVGEADDDDAAAGARDEL
ncbi:MAG: hypothetical protein LQ352_001690 [Teloschistes flavicans]|nr:MAG: hypothetical protein LQ352_001690 [Teloschistes flavicans]